MIPGITASRRRLFTAFDPYWENVALLLHFDGEENSLSMVDSSRYNHTITENAGAELKAASAEFGQTGLSVSLVGNARVPVTHPTAFSITGAFTIEGWLRVKAPTDSYWYALQIANSGDNHNSRFTMRWTDGGFGGVFQASMNDANRIIGPTRSAVFGTYVHVAYCRDADGVCRLFFDGELQGSTVDTTDLSVCNMVVVGGTVNNAYRFLGDMDEWRFTNGVCRYTEPFTPPDGPFPDVGP